MKILITICVLIILVGCGARKNQPDNNLKSDTISTHNVDSELNIVKESLIYSDNVSITLVDEIIVTEGLEGNYSNPKFSSDGKKLFFTNNNYSQIWMYDISQKQIQQISSLPGSGYKFSISNDGSKIYFRNKATKSKTKKRISSIIEQEVGSKNHNIIYTTENQITQPVLVSEHVFFLENDNVKCFDLSSKSFITDSDLPILFVNDNKIIKYKYGRDIKINETRTDYIDLDYSSDGKYISCLTKTNGVEVLDIEGNIINTYQDAVSLSILQNSNLVVFNKELDDGLTTIKSNLFLGFLNSEKVIKLENNNDEKRFQASWSPSENKISYTTENGVIKIVSFNIEKN